jgi:precorrin-6Y C5,15-methyltransferase (decarboxylating)
MVNAETLSQSSLPSLSVLAIVNDAWDDRIPSGLPDDAFERIEGVPLTKAEVRALSLSKLSLRPGDICYDIGAGSGSVSVEMALAAYRGRVYAVERREDALSLIAKNAMSFHLGNVIAIHGEAPEALAGLPPPDAVFIGGSGGSIKELLAVVQGKNPRARIVVTAITVETAAAVLSAFPDAELTQLSVARSKRAGDSHLLMAQNPVMIMSIGLPALGGNRE